MVRTITALPTTRISEPAILRRREREIVARHSGGLAWGTVWLACGLTVLYGLTLALAGSGNLPLWVGTLLNTLCAYGFYTVHHEANHGNISGSPRPTWLDRWLGRLAALPLTLDFDGYAPLHLMHNTYTNQPDRDPDYLVAGKVAALPLKWLLGVLIFPTLRALPFVGEAIGERISKASPNHLVRASTQRLRRFDQACFVVLFVAAAFGFGLEAFLLWWLPGRLSALVLMVVFQWLPHHPHKETTRYRNTRVNVFPLSTPALLHQDHHLLHHLFPRVPWYRYRRLFAELRPLLEMQGARLEGRGLGPGSPPIAMA